MLSVLLIASCVLPKESHQSKDLLAKMDGVSDYLGQTLKAVQDIDWKKTPYPAECTECFERLGCFDACNGTFNYTYLLPDTPEHINTTFNLFPWSV